MVEATSSAARRAFDNAIRRTSREEAKQSARDRIRDAALMLFKNEGYLETSVEAILSAAQIGRTTFYTYYPNKMSLLFDLVDLDIERQKARYRDLAAIPEPTQENLAQWLHGVAEANVARVAIARVYSTAIGLNPALWRQFADARDEYCAILAPSFARFGFPGRTVLRRQRQRAYCHHVLVLIEQICVGYAEDHWSPDLAASCWEVGAMLMAARRP